MALTYRSTKGSPLTIEEIDNNVSYFTGSHSVTGSLTVSGSVIINGSLLTTEALQVSGTLNPVDSNGSSLGSPEFFWGELYISTGSVNFMGLPGSQVASIKVWGEGAAYPEPASGMVYIAPFYYSGSSVVQKFLRGSFGVGTGSIALGTGSVTLGRYLQTFGNYQTAVGAFNQTSSANSAFIVGNGTSTSNRSNLLFASGSQVQITGSLAISGAAALSGDISFTTSNSGIVQTLTEIFPTGTASYYGNTLDNVSTNTTTYLSYGINVVATGSLGTGSHCCRLPEVPKKGKSVTIINNDGIDLFVFPSTASGDINGNIDGYFVVPSDGNSYVFNCYENPLPGGWSAINIPNGNTAYNTGIITYNETSSGALSFINNSIKVITNGATGAILTDSNLLDAGIIIYGGYVAPQAYYLPTNAWQKINSISILTNVTEALRYNSSLTLSSVANSIVKFAGSTLNGDGSGVNYDYNLRNSMISAWSQANLGTDLVSQGNAWSGVSTVAQTFNGATPGTFTSASSNNPYISAGGVGAPGTMKMTWNINPYMVGAPISRMIGKFYIGSILGTYNPNPNPITYGPSQLYDIYWYHSFSPSLNIVGYVNGNYVTDINNVKFRMILNVTPN